jgi:hypothetical protein
MKLKKLACIALAALSLSAISLPVSADWGKTEDGGVYYTLEDGTKAVGFTEIDGETYYFRKDGTMLVGSYKINGKSYTFDKDGKLVKSPAASRSYFLDAYFGESRETVMKRTPTVEIKDDMNEFTSAADSKPIFLKMGDTYAIGINGYFFLEDKYTMGGKVYVNTIDYTADSAYDISGKDVKDLTKAQINAIYNAFVKNYTKLYGEPVDLAAKGLSEFDDFQKVSVFLSGNTIYCVIADDEYAGVMAIDLSIYTEYKDITLDELLEFLS